MIFLYFMKILYRFMDFIMHIELCYLLNMIQISYEYGLVSTKCLIQVQIN